MAYERDFEEYMIETVSIAPYAGKDSRGVRSYGTAKEYKCRVVGAGVSLRRSSNEDNTVIYDIFTNGIPIGETAMAAFTMDDKVTLPDDTRWEDRTPEIFAVKRYTDDDGFHHVKIQCGYMYHRQGQ